MSPVRTPPRRSFEEIAEGELVTPYTLDLTLQRLIMDAGSARDYAPIHHDRDMARATGAPDVYAGTLFLEAMMETAVRHWAGLGAWLRDFELSIRDFSLVGDVLTAGGVVRSRPAPGLKTSVLLDVWIDSQRGRNVEGTVIVDFAGVPTMSD